MSKYDLPKNFDYKNTDALVFHRKTSHYKNYRSKITDLLEKPIIVKILNSLDPI